MVNALKRSWKGLKNARPGQRFQNAYRRHHEAGKRGRVKGLLFIVVGLALFGAGLVMLVAPGPGILAVVGGAALVARESRPLSKLLDWLELKIRAVVKRLRAEWRAASVPVRGLAVFGVLLGGGAIAVRVVQLLTRG